MPYTEEERELDRRAEARAGAWMKVQRNATMVQRPDLYSQAIAMPALDATTFTTLLEREDMLHTIVETFQALPDRRLS